jgi:hypothetical protein
VRAAVRLGSSVSVSGPCFGGVISAAEASQLDAELSVLVGLYSTDSSSLVGDMRVQFDAGSFCFCPS